MCTVAESRSDFNYSNSVLSSNTKSYDHISAVRRPTFEKPPTRPLSNSCTTFSCQIRAHSGCHQWRIEAGFESFLAGCADNETSAPQYCDVRKSFTESDNSERKPIPLPPITYFTFHPTIINMQLHHIWIVGIFPYPR